MKKKFMLFLFISTLLVGCNNNSVTIDEKDFEKGLETFIKSEYNESEYDATLKDGKMEITYEDTAYTLVYDLKNNPTFTYEIEVKKGISYDDYLVKTEGLSLPMLGYVASLSTYGVEVEDSALYFAMTYFSGMMNYYDADKETYVVIDDEFADGFESDSTIILKSQFGDKVIDFVKNSYGENIVIKDKEYDTYTYNLTSDCDKDSCTLTAELEVNKDGKFDKIKGYADNFTDNNMNDDITEDNADYHIELFVGQKVTVTGEELNGYEKSGSAVDIESVMDGYEISALEEGSANGYFYIGEDSRTFYITVTEGEFEEENLTLDIE